MVKVLVVVAIVEPAPLGYFLDHITNCAFLHGCLFKSFIAVELLSAIETTGSARVVRKRSGREVVGGSGGQVLWAAAARGLGFFRESTVLLSAVWIGGSELLAKALVESEAEGKAPREGFQFVEGEPNVFGDGVEVAIYVCVKGAAVVAHLRVLKGKALLLEEKHCIRQPRALVGGPHHVAGSGFQGRRCVKVGGEVFHYVSELFVGQLQVNVRLARDLLQLVKKLVLIRLKPALHTALRTSLIAFFFGTIVYYK